MGYDPDRDDPGMEGPDCDSDARDDPHELTPDLRDALSPSHVELYDPARDPGVETAFEISPDIRPDKPEGLQQYVASASRPAGLVA